MPHRAFIGIGTNLGDRATNFREAIHRIAGLPDTRVVRQASIYETEPVGDVKGWFLNSVIEIETEGRDNGLGKLVKRLGSFDFDVAPNRALALKRGPNDERTVLRHVETPRIGRVEQYIADMEKASTRAPFPVDGAGRNDLTQPISL